MHIRQRLRKEFVPKLSQLPGFVAYYLTDAGDGRAGAGSGSLIFTTIFRDRPGVDEPTRLAARPRRVQPRDRLRL